MRKYVGQYGMTLDDLEQVYQKIMDSVKTYGKSTEKEPYSVDYRSIKYPKLEFKTGNLLVVLPKTVEDEKEILQKHQNWIRKKESTLEKH